MYYFLFFILGFICSQYILPLIKSVWAIFLTRLEIPKGKYALQVAKLNLEMTDLSDESGPQQVIGFAYNGDDEEEDQEAED